LHQDGNRGAVGRALKKYSFPGGLQTTFAGRRALPRNGRSPALFKRAR
jgi:hypothetical protein